MRRGLFCTLGLTAALAGPVRAGWKITTRTDTESVHSILTEYFDGGLRRTEQTDSNGHRYITILDFNHPRQILLNLDLQQYVVIRLTRRYEGFTLSPETIVIDQVTTDTGERRTIFGRTARHLLTRETSHVEGGGIGPPEKQIDGWYVDADTLPHEKRGGFVHFLAVGRSRPNIKVSHSGPATTGLAVWQKITSISPEETREWTIAVTELVEGPLAKDLFEPPPDFRRVISFPGDYPLSWSQQIQRRWEWLEDLFTGLGD